MTRSSEDINEQVFWRRYVSHILSRANI
jgi:hypothetical protein